jgi:hypothetical protein
MGSIQTIRDGHVPPSQDYLSEALLQLLARDAPYKGVEVPKHAPLSIIPNTLLQIDVVGRFDHAKVRELSEAVPEPALYRFQIKVG